jgi:hypothetical protein
VGSHNEEITMKQALCVLCLLLLTLTGCSDEASERRAFIGFLQEHIISRPGMHLVLMDDELTKECGRYVSHYQIILDFHHDLNLTQLERFAHLKSEISRPQRLRHPPRGAAGTAADGAGDIRPR